MSGEKRTSFIFICYYSPSTHRSYERTAPVLPDRTALTAVRSERAPRPERARRSTGRWGRAAEQPGQAGGGGGAACGGNPGTPQRADGSPGRNVTYRELVVVIGGTEGLPQQNGARERCCW